MEVYCDDCKYLVDDDGYCECFIPEPVSTCHQCGGNTFDGFDCEICGENTDMKDDIVQEPSHYARWVIEPITFIMKNGFDFWRGNIIKYASRAGYKMYEGKTQVESEIIDLEKVIRYSEMRINQLKGKDRL